MHSSVIGKIEKANRYARERDRFVVERLSVTVRGDNDSHRVRLDPDGWQCACHAFESLGDCAHVLAIQKLLAGMVPEDHASALVTAPPGATAEPLPA
ncbi:MAG: hypothetical protein KF809_05020 [Chloroflexi bacterium]|nr:hypothetical protein [Chloroflexota bacterium]